MEQQWVQVELKVGQRWGSSALLLELRVEQLWSCSEPQVELQVE